MPELGDRIKYLREKKGMTQKDLIGKAQLTIVQLSRYETNDRKPDPDALGRIADVLETNTDYLLGRTDDPRPMTKSHRNNSVAESDAEFLAKLKQIADKRNYDLHDPRFLELIDIAFEISERIRQKKPN